MKLSVIIPVYNEKNTIEEIIKRVLAVDISKEVIVVDDGSTDGTTEILRKIAKKNKIKVFFSSRKPRKRSSYLNGFRACRR